MDRQSYGRIVLNHLDLKDELDYLLNMGWGKHSKSEEREENTMIFTSISANKFETVFNGELFTIEASREVEGDSFRLRAEWVTSDSGDTDGIEAVSRAFDDAHGWESYDDE